MLRWPRKSLYGTWFLRRSSFKGTRLKHSEARVVQDEPVLPVSVVSRPLTSHWFSHHQNAGVLELASRVERIDVDLPSTSHQHWNENFSYLLNPSPSTSSGSSLSSLDSRLSIPTAVDTSTISDYAALLQAYFDPLDGNYDVEGILTDFVEGSYERGDQIMGLLAEKVEPEAAAVIPHESPSNFPIRSYSTKPGAGLRKALLQRFVYPPRRRTFSTKMAFPLDVEEDVIEVTEETPPKLRFDPPAEGRISVATTEELELLTTLSDIDGLRRTLNTKHWPLPNKLGAKLLNKIFEVFINKATDTEEIKMLFRDFAVINNRVFIHDRVVLSFLRRLIVEDGIPAAIDYSRLHRHMFLVRPPLEPVASKSLDRMSRSLFRVAFEQPHASFQVCQHLYDALSRHAYINDSKAFVTESISFELKRAGYDAAYGRWQKHVEMYRTTHGKEVLLLAALADKDQSRVETRIRGVLSSCQNQEHPFGPLAELIMAYVSLGMAEEAKYLMISLSISGTHFKEPLRRLLDERKSEVLEKFAAVFADFLKDEGLLKRRSEGYQKTPIPQSVEFLVCSWRVQKKRKFDGVKKVKAYKSDVEQRQQLIYVIQKTWLGLALRSNDKELLKRLHEWNARIRTTLSPDLAKTYASFLKSCDVEESTTVSLKRSISG